MRLLQRRVTWLMLASFFLQILLPNAASADKFFAKLSRLVHETEYAGTPPNVCQDCAVETLAENIDWLEHHIDCYGSIVAKQPDIWGEARLTKHRDEFERVMFQELNQFQFKLNAAIRQTDASFASAALALSNAASDGSVADPNKPAAAATAVAILPKTPATSADSKISLENFKTDKINIEPTVYLDQLNRYVHHLHELRRINEGDDTSDSPGYSLNLVRIPVSILPGKMTREGFGAEITITAKSHLSEDLLPTTFRNLVIHDVVHLNALPVTKFLLNDQDKSKKQLDKFEELKYRMVPWMEAYDRWLESLECGQPSEHLQRTIDFYHTQREYLLNRFLQVAIKAKGQREAARKQQLTQCKGKEGDLCDGFIPTKKNDFAFFEESSISYERLAQDYREKIDEIVSAVSGNNPIFRQYLDVTVVKLVEEILFDEFPESPAEAPVEATAQNSPDPKQDKPKQAKPNNPKQKDAQGKADESSQVAKSPLDQKFDELKKALSGVSSSQATQSQSQDETREQEAFEKQFKEIKQLLLSMRDYLQKAKKNGSVCVRFGVTWIDLAKWMDDLAKVWITNQQGLDAPTLKVRYQPFRDPNGCDVYSLLTEHIDLIIRLPKPEEIAEDLSITRQLLPLVLEASDNKSVYKTLGQHLCGISLDYDKTRPNNMEPLSRRPNCPDEIKPTEPIPAPNGSPTEAADDEEETPRDESSPLMLRLERSLGAIPSAESIKNVFLRARQYTQALLQFVNAIEEALSKDLPETLTEINIQNFLGQPYNNNPSNALAGFDVSFELEGYVPPIVAASRSSQLDRPLPPSHYIPVLGLDNFFYKALDTYRTFSLDPIRKRFLSILDIRQLMLQEAQGAYNWLSDPEHLYLWEKYCTPQLASAIERLDRRTINVMRRQFMRDVGVPTAQNITGSLAWEIIFSAALLNKRLNDDVRKVAKAKSCCNLQPGRDLNFSIPDSVNRPVEEFGPETQVLMQNLQAELQEACYIFNQYVECRWPIHVFAIDPREQDQNVADFSARRRELQLALSMGFVSGEISANKLMQHSRALETQIETISLNRTIAGFGHGADTFGWRFFPRVQALDVPGMAGSIWQSIGGVDRDCDLCHRQLEPGMRECVAIVLMPSFVPYADFTVRSNWFKLTNPRNSALTMKDTMLLSKSITAMRQSRAQCAACAHCYRPGEISNLMTRVNQLDRELPLQNMITQLPRTENGLGGHQMFNTGVSDLAPDLIGWYGAPGVVVVDDVNQTYACGCYSDCEHCGPAEGAIACRRASGISNVIERLGDSEKRALPFPVCEGEGTTLFLVGHNFSVHDTKVIAGGVCIPHVRLISRELMRVTIPSCVNKFKEGDKEYVSVSLATPYGVTNHLPIPVVSRDLDKKTKEKIEEEVTKQVEAAVKKQVDGLKLAEQDVVVEFKKEAKLEVEALCEKNDPSRLLFLRKPGTSIPSATVEVKNPFLLKPTPAKAKFFVSVNYKGQYRTEMLPLINPDNTTDPSIFILKEKMSFTASNYSSPVRHSIMKAIADEVPLSELIDGKEEAKLVFFMSLDGNSGQVPAMELKDDMTISITSPCKCCDTVAKGTTETLPTPAGEKTDAEEKKDGEKTSATQDADCNCSTASALEYTYR